LRIYEEPGNEGTMLGYLSGKERREELGISDTRGGGAEVISLWLLGCSFFLLLRASTSCGRYVRFRYNYYYYVCILFSGENGGMGGAGRALRAWAMGFFGNCLSF
jgi:hypothetical protein